MQAPYLALKAVMCLQLDTGKKAATGLVRAPYLALVDLAARAKQLGIQGEARIQLLPQMLAYWARFQSRAVVQVDLRRYLMLLDDREKANMCNALDETQASIRAEVCWHVSGCRAG
jgi:hypothetical protein